MPSACSGMLLKVCGYHKRWKLLRCGLFSPQQSPYLLSPLITGNCSNVRLDWIRKNDTNCGRGEREREGAREVEEGEPTALVGLSYTCCRTNVPGGLWGQRERKSRGEPEVRDDGENCPASWQKMQTNFFMTPLNDF